uniref:Uncharacterized protein n=1 Tax=Rhizophora mucronata TaxID=61149 RepID=A0A2P2L2N9_RHIMU
MHPFFLISQIFKLVSEEPDAKNSPNGWNSTAVQLDLCPIRVRTIFASSKSHNFIAPVEAPLSTKTSAASKVTDSTGLV